MANEYQKQKQINEFKENWYNKFNTVSRFAKQDNYFIIRQEINHTHCSLKSKGYKKIDLTKGNLLDKDLEKQVQEERGTNKIDDEEDSQKPVTIRLAEINSTLRKNNSNQDNPKARLQELRAQKQQSMSRTKSAGDVAQSNSNTERTEFDPIHYLANQHEKLATLGQVKKDEFQNVEINHLRKDIKLQEKVLQTDKMESGKQVVISSRKNNEGIPLMLSGQENMEERDLLIDAKMFGKHKSSATLDLIKIASSTNAITNKFMEKSNSMPRINNGTSTTRLEPKEESIMTRFSNFGKEIHNLETKAKRFSKTVSKTQRTCDQAFKHMGDDLNSENVIHKFKEVVTKVQLLDVEWLINDMRDIQNKKFSGQQEFANYYEKTKSRKETSIEELLKGTNQIQVNQDLMELDIQRISDARHMRVQDLVKGTNRIQTMVNPTELQNINTDTLTQEELDNLDLISVYCKDKFDMGFISRKDIEEHKNKFRQRLRDINANLKQSKQAYESDRLEKGYIYPDHKDQVKQSQLITSKKDSKGPGNQYLFQMNVGGNRSQKEIDKLQASLKQNSLHEREKNPKFGYIKQTNSQVSKKDLQMLGMDTELYKELNQIDEDQTQNRQNGIRGNIFTERKEESKINFKRPTLQVAERVKSKDIEFDTSVEAQVKPMDSQVKDQEVIVQENVKENNGKAQQHVITKKDLIQKQRGAADKQNVSQVAEVQEVKKPAPIMKSFKIQTDKPDKMFNQESRWITENKIVQLGKNQNASQLIDVSKINENSRI